MNKFITEYVKARLVKIFSDSDQTLKKSIKYISEIHFEILFFPIHFNVQSFYSCFKCERILMVFKEISQHTSNVFYKRYQEK